MLGVPVRTWAMALQGLGGQPIEVQAVVLSGLPRVIVVGLPDVAIGEATDRIRAAFGALGKTLPPHRITLNLSPVDLPKHGAGFDLAMAVAPSVRCTLVSSGLTVPCCRCAGYCQRWSRLAKPASAPWWCHGPAPPRPN